VPPDASAHEKKKVTATSAKTTPRGGPPSPPWRAQPLLLLSRSNSPPEGGGGAKKGGVFKASATDDLSECGLSSFPVNVQRVIGQGDQKPDTPGENARYHQKQVLLVKNFSLASKHWLLS